MDESNDRLTVLKGALPESEWLRRSSEADRQAAVLEPVLKRVRSGEGKRPAIRIEVHGEPVTTWLGRLLRYESGGRDRRVSRRLPVVK
jgi:hypothetical protein